ncbi:MAG: hypothetical protein ACYT04_54880 [Nostoc sp.]
MPSLREASPTAGFAYAFFNKPQRRKERRRERSHRGDFAGDRFFISRRGKREESDRTVEILQAIAFFNEPQSQKRAIA